MATLLMQCGARRGPSRPPADPRTQWTAADVADESTWTEVLTDAEQAELDAALIFAASMLTLALLMLLAVVPTTRGRLAQTLLVVSAASLVVTMLLTCSPG